MIVVTGAAGFIASNVVKALNDYGRQDLILVDDFSKEEKRRNYEDRFFHCLVHRDEFLQSFRENHDNIECVIHLGARTDTTEFDYNVFQQLNVDYTLALWNLCTAYRIPLIYASSAATYGMGELGYDDRHDIVFDLKPLNPYGRSKNEIDKYILTQEEQPPFWAGLKFFNDLEGKELQLLDGRRLVLQRQFLHLSPLLQRHEEQHTGLHTILTACDARIAHAVTALIEVKRCLAGLPSWIPNGVAILDVEIASAIVHRHIVVTIARDATEFGILVKTVATCSVTD